MEPMAKEVFQTCKLQLIIGGFMIIKQWRGQSDDTPFDVPGYTSSIAPIYSGTHPPRLWTQASVTDAKWWSFSPLASMAFRVQFQFKLKPIISNILCRFFGGTEVRLVQNSNNSLQIEQGGVGRNVSTILDLSREVVVNLILHALSFTWEVRYSDIVEGPVVYSGSGTFSSTAGPFTSMRIRHCSPEILWDNLQINDDVSCFIGPEPLNPKQGGDPFVDPEFLFF